MKIPQWINIKSFYIHAFTRSHRSGKRRRKNSCEMITPTNKLQLCRNTHAHTCKLARKFNQLVAKILTHIIYNKGMKLYWHWRMNSVDGDGEREKKKEAWFYKSPPAVCIVHFMINKICLQMYSKQKNLKWEKSALAHSLTFGKFFMRVNFKHKFTESFSTDLLNISSWNFLIQKCNAPH